MKRQTFDKLKYWVFGSRKKFQQGFLPRFKCSTRKELTAFINKVVSIFWNVEPNQ